MGRWVKMFFAALSAILGFVLLAGALEWYAVYQYDRDLWLLAHQYEARMEAEAGKGG